ncbi:unnamed protein product [Rotaria sordida]|uniref:CAP-Gly domain-containing protein n=1 Tax=Rotaria sordida TaxID=392033 RepID=A0A819JVQ1_9BILA|nr:unnamed protein product [Rotaria sordida]
MHSSLNTTQNDLRSNQLSTNSIIEELNLNKSNYEKEIEYLQKQLIHLNSYSSTINNENNDSYSLFSQWYLSNELLNKSEQHQNFIDHLKQEFIRISSLVSEANTISDEMQRQIIYNVILQISISYLKPNERSIDNLCLPVIQIKRKNLPLQIWDTENFESQLNHMKNLYKKWIISENKTDFLIQELKRNNPFFDEQSNSFIGIANIYLKALFYDSKLDYIVPIINTQGEMSGSLHVVMSQTGLSSMKKFSELQINSTTSSSNRHDGISIDTDDINFRNTSNSQHSLEDEGIDDSSTLSNSQNDEVTIKFAIKEIRDLPKSDAEYVMCRYTFINPKLDQTILSQKSFKNNDNEQQSYIFSFNHENEYTFPITDNFLSTCFESVVSIEIWYQYNTKLQSIDIKENNEINQRNILIQEISQYWKDVKRHVKFSVEIHELDSLGQWKPVEVDVHEKIISGGIYRLKQGQSKRLVVQLRIIPRSDPMPLVFHEIRSVEIGSISTRKIHAPYQLDSYQDEDLQNLRSIWLNYIEKRKIYLESQINILNQQTNKTPIDIHRESILLEELIHLTEERNIALFPPPSSGIPGCPAAWDPPSTIEIHRPIIFLNLDPIDMNTSNNIAGLQAILNEENKTRMFQLPLIQNASDEIRAVAQWDPTIHESDTMNQVTPNDTLIYLIVKIIVMISQPVHMELILRKRIAITISKTEGWWPEKTLKNFLGYKTHKGTSIVYEIVSHIPKNLHDIKEQKKIDDQCCSDDNIEKYIQYSSQIDSVLLLDKLRQEVLLAENSAKQQTVRKATSVSNITHQQRNTNVLHSSMNTQQEYIDNQILTIPNETMLSSSQSELNSSTPSMISRSLFIEEEQLQPIQTSTFQIKHIIDLDDNRPQENENTLEQKYNILSSQSIETSPNPIINNNNNIEDYTIGSRVIVNTGHSIYNKSGTIRFIGEMSIKTGIWYGIELDEQVGKNNGSLDGHIYFKCQDKHGIFVRRDKIQLIN